MQKEHVKTLFNLRDVLPTLANANPHNWGCRHGAVAVNTKGVPVPSFESADVVYDEAWINHYVVKSWEDFQAKMARGNGGRRGGGVGLSPRTWAASGLGMFSVSHRPPLCLTL